MALYTKMIERMPRTTNPGISEATAPNMAKCNPLPFRQAGNVMKWTATIRFSHTIR